MNYLNGGYVMIDKADSNIYSKALGALNAGKPILWYENSTTCYYIDTLAKSGDDIVLTKGSKTITITDANVITESGEIQPKLYKYRFNVSDMYVSFVTTKLYKFETNKEYQVNSDDDYTTCVLTGDLLQSLKDLLANLPDYTCSITSDNNAILNTGSNICVELSGTKQFELSNNSNILVTDSTNYSEEIYLNIYEI